MGGDLAAGEQLKTVGDHLLEAAEKAYGTTGAWQAIADKIERGYSSVATKAESQASIASQQLSVLQEQLAELRRIASGGAPAQPISQSGTTAQDWNSLNASYASAYDAAKSSGMSDSQWVSSSQFGVFQQALLNRIGNSSDIGKLESDLGAYSDAPADSPFAANASLVTGAIRSRLRALNVPGYKYGGAHAGGLRMVGEEGAELEVTGPARYYSHQQTRAMLGSAMQDNAGLGGKLDQLIGQNTQLLSYVSRLVSINQGQSELLKEQAQIIKRQDQLLRDRDLQRRAA